MARLYLAILFAAVILAGPAHAERRVALVIGNSAYEHAANLRNPRNDAEDVAAMFTRLGFDVALAADLGFQEMRRALAEFADKAHGADVAAVFYAGHGIEVDRQNYLIPVDSRLASDRQIRFETIALDDVLAAVEGARGLQIIILDACRENPFASSMERTVAGRSIGRGLARIEPEGSSVLVAFAAKEGQVADDGEARNSPYTTALLGNLEEPGVEINIAFRRVRQAVMDATHGDQQPFVYSSLGADPIHLVPGERQAAPAPATPPAPAQPPAQPATASLDPVVQAYEATRAIDTVAAWDAFLAAYPDGFYAELARAARAKLAAVPAAPPPAAPPPSPSSPRRVSWETTYAVMYFPPELTGDIVAPYDSDEGRIIGRMAGSVLVGHWVEKGSNRRCPTARDGSYYWGRIEFSFDAARTGFTGRWSYCDEPLSTAWNGQRTPQ